MLKKYAKDKKKLQQAFFHTSRHKRTTTTTLHCTTHTSASHHHHHSAFPLFFHFPCILQQQKYIMGRERPCCVLDEGCGRSETETVNENEEGVREGGGRRRGGGDGGESWALFKARSETNTVTNKKQTDWEDAQKRKSEKE